MDDIDVGVDSIQAAKRVLKNIDLVLQTRQIRLNSGKTLILRSEEAERHFRVRENIILNNFQSAINRHIKSGRSVSIYRNRMSRSFKMMYRRKKFDTGNGEKILKRIIGISTRIGAELDNRIIADIITRRPSCRSIALRYLSRFPMKLDTLRASTEILHKRMVVDDATLVEMANYLVETYVPKGHRLARDLKDAQVAMSTSEFFSLYARIWLASKYSPPDELLRLIKLNIDEWRGDPWLGRLVGSLNTLFAHTPSAAPFRSMVMSSGNDEAIASYLFMEDLRNSSAAFDEAYNFLKATNPTKGTHISHARFLMVISALGNANADAKKIQNLLSKHRTAWSDYYYGAILKRSTGTVAFPAAPPPSPPVP